MSLETGPETFYGLSGRPFSLSPDPAFFFGSKVHRRVLAYLEYGVYQAEGFIVVTGEIGAGKTTLVRKLVGSLDPEKVVGAQLVSTQLDGDETLRMVMAAFGLRATNKSKALLLMRFERFLKACREEGKRALLVVDEAQNLSHSALEELRMLSNYQVTDRSLIQTFLVGQPEFRNTMSGGGLTQLRQRVVAACHLPPLDPSDTRAYIQHRLTKVNWHGNPSFDDEAIDEIHAFSGGIPRRINTLCERLLLLGFVEEKRVLGIKEVREVITEIQSEMPSFGEPDPAIESEEAPFAFPGPQGFREVRELITEVQSEMPRSGEPDPAIDNEEAPFAFLGPHGFTEVREVITEVQSEMPRLVEPGPAIEGQEVVFTFSEPHAARVHLSGSWDQWAVRTPMQRGGHGLFRVRIRVKEKGPHVYKYLVDEITWVADPSNPARIHDGYGGYNSVLSVPGP